MSYKFDASNDRIKGSFATATYGLPVTIAAFVKVVNHPMASQVILNLGNSSSSVNDSVDIRTAITDNQWGCRSTSSAGVSTTALETQSIDGVWAGVVGVIIGDADRWIYVLDETSSSQDTVSRAITSALQHLQIGENLGNATDFGAANPNESKIAEVAIWNVELTQSEIGDYMTGTPASSIQPGNLIGYWPLSADNATQSNLGTDADGDLTVTAAVYDSDHPTITTGGTTLTPNTAGMSV